MFSRRRSLAPCSDVISTRAATDFNVMTFIPNRRRPSSAYAGSGNSASRNSSSPAPLIGYQPLRRDRRQRLEEFQPATAAPWLNILNERLRDVVHIVATLSYQVNCHGNS